MVTIAPKEKGWSDIGEAFGTGAVSGYQNRSDERALQNAIASLPPDASAKDIIKAVTGAKTYSPEAKKTMLNNYFEANKQEENIRHHKATEEKKVKNTVDNELLKDQLIASGMPDYEADLYVNSPPGVQGRIIASHQDLLSRGVRKPLTPEIKLGVEESDQNKPQEKAIVTEEITPNKDVIKEEITAPEIIPEPKISLDKEGYPFPEIPPETTFKEKEAWRTKNQAFNNKELKALHDKTNDEKKIEVSLGIAKNYNNSGKLPKDLGRIIIDPNTGEPYPLAQLSGLVNKETQGFVKTINDFISGAKAFFGGRVSNFEVDTFKSRLPTLMNTEEGRRLIIEQMDLMTKLQGNWNKEMEAALKHYGRNADYNFIMKVADERSKEKDKEIISKLDNLVKATDYLDMMYSKPEKYKNAQLVQDPKTGDFKAIDKSKLNEAKKRGYITW